MIIHQLQIENFKSYNGKHVIGPFDTHFNCVIGPNGNGKSNIIDSVLFAFGFKSAKLRQDSLASLIHKSAFAKPDKATVQVIFRQGKQFTSISRTILRSGNSYYKLNGEKTNWNDLRERLIQKKIDLNKNLFIILQGQVQRLCQLAPDTMVQYLQYVSGSDELKQPIDIKQKQFIESSIIKQENKVSLNHKRTIYEKLKQHATNQIAWILLKLRYILYQHLNIKKIIFSNIHSMKAYKQQEECELDQLKKIEEQLKTKEQTLRQKKRQLNQIYIQLKKGQQYLQKIQQKQRNTTLKLKNINRQILYIIKDKQKKQQQIKRYQNDIQQIKQIKQKQNQFINKYNQIKNILNKLNNLNQFIKCYQLQNNFQQICKQKQYLNIKCKEDQNTLNYDRQKLKIYQSKYKQNNFKKQKNNEEIKLLNDERQQIVYKINENQQIINQLQRRLQDKNNNKIISNQQKIIHQIKNANKLKIICSDYYLTILRQFVIIDNQYINVVQTILPHLDYFIVDNIKQAQQITEYLNKKKIGRVTILIKQLINNSIKDIKIIEHCPKQTQLIMNVCKCTNQQVKNILIWALGNTLVTNKLDIAMKVAYYDDKKYRVITTNGQFIDSSGTMTKLSLKNGSQKEDHQFLSRKLQTIKKMQSTLEIKRSTNEKALNNLMISLHEIESQQRSFDGLDEIFLQQLQKQIKENHNKILKLSSQKENINNKLQKLKKDLKIQIYKSDLQYKQILILIKSYVENEQKIKKIQSSNNLLTSLSQKNKILSNIIKEINIKMQQKVKQKVLIDNQKMKYITLIDEIKKKIQIIGYGKKSVNQQIKNLDNQIKFLQSNNNSNIGKNNNNNNNKFKIKQMLKKIRNKLKQIQYHQIQMNNNLFTSIKQIKQYSFICKDLYKKYPQLIKKIYQQFQNNQNNQNKKQKQQQQQQNNQTYLNQKLLLNIKLNIGKNQSYFQQFLSKKQKQYLLLTSLKNNTSCYNDIEDIKLQKQNQQQLFQLIPIKQIQFSQTYQQSKIKYLQKQLSKYDQYHQSLINFQLLEEYKQKKQQYQIQLQKMNSLNLKIEIFKNQLIQLRNKRLDIFMTNFNEINIQLNIIYNKLTGGKAELNFIDSMNPFQGVQFSVRPVNKSWKRVNLLSGGEKTFTSLALIFACEQIKKFPFYFMDQIDAALDYKNTTLLSHYLKEKVGTQHIVISLRKNMYQESNHIVGVYKIQDQSRILQISMEQLKKRDNL